MGDYSAEQQLLPLSKMIVDEVVNRLKQDGLVIASPRSTSVSSRNTENRIALKVAAEMLGHGYHWLSRNYITLGLRPSRVGRRLLFEREAVEKLLDQRKVRPVGRPRIDRFAL